MNIGRFIRNYLLFLIPLAVLTSLTFWMIHNQTMGRVTSELKLESNILAGQVRDQLNLSFAEIHSDLKLLTEHYKLHQLDSLIKPRNVINELQELWISVAEQRARYDQVRFLDAQGQETIRINYSDHKATATPKQKLQSKRHRYYFIEAINTPVGEIWNSLLDLNIERRQIELPLKPTIRFSTRIDRHDGQPDGVIIINYLAKNLLDKFRSVTASYSGHALLLNWQGYSLVSPNAANDWGFMFPDSPQSRISIEHEAAWQATLNEKQGQLLNPKGLYTYNQIDPSGSNTAASDCDSCLWLMLHVPSQLIEVQLWRELSKTIPLLLLSFFLIAIILGVALWHREKRQAHERQIQELNRNISYEHELFLSSPGVIAKLRNEIGWPIEFISSNIEELLDYDADHFASGKVAYASMIDSEYLEKYTQETLEAENKGSNSFSHSPYLIVGRNNRSRWIQETAHAIRDKLGKLTGFYVHINDVTPLKEAEQRLTQSRDYIQKVVDTIPDPTMVIDINSYELTLINQSALELYNKGQAIDPQTTCYRLSHKRSNPCKGQLDPCPIQQIMEKRTAVSVVHKHYDHQGNIIHVDVRATPIFDDSGENIIQIIESHRDITETVEMEKQLQHIAETDRLTQIYNRMKFDEELKNQIAWASLTNNRFGLIMFDLDHFKKINDTYGHDMGDKVLINTVDLLNERIRKSDVLARWGGEEFMIIAPLIDTKELRSLVESLRNAVQQYEHEGVGSITASFGASVVRPSDNIHSLLKRVDSALYESKQKGRNRSTVF
ncbi:MAG: diguanylate cyclase [Candidatus Thiodiazotropha taylori]|nr:diguanylate cyclase [Candidatus Thiodiazotropha taylori]